MLLSARVCCPLRSPLSQKWKQLSFLHVYHHSTIFVFYWLNANIGYDGDIYLTIVLNGAIHAMMYTYYFLTMHRSKSGEMVYVWWKSYLTLAQLAQFSCMVAQALTLLYKDGCRYAFGERVGGV